MPSRIVIGQTRAIKWSNVAPAIADMRVEAREQFSKTGAKGGREVAAFSKITQDGSDVTVGLEVANAKDSPALSNGFAATVIVPPGQYLRADHASGPGTSVAPWITFMTRIPKEGYALSQPLSLFEVYSGTGGEESMAMYAAVEKASE